MSKPDQEPAQEHESRITFKRVLRYIFPVVVLGLAVHLVLPQFTNLEHAYEVIRGMTVWAVVMAVLMQTASYLSRGFLLKSLPDTSHNAVTIGKGTLITLGGVSFGMIAGGMVGSSAMIYHWMKKSDAGSEAAVLAGTVPPIIIDLVLGGVSVLGLIHLLLTHQLTRRQAISYGTILTALLAIIILFIWGLRNRSRLIQLASKAASRITKLLHLQHKPERLASRLEWLFSVADLLLSKNWRKPLFAGVLFASFDMLTLFFLFIAASHPISLGMLLTGYGFPLLLGKLAFMVPGGIGVIESTMSGLFTSMGVQGSITVVVVLAYRLLSFWLPLLLGFPIIFALQHRISRAAG